MKLDLLSEGVWDTIKGVLNKPLLGSDIGMDVRFVMDWGDKETTRRLLAALPPALKWTVNKLPPSRVMSDPNARRLAAKKAKDLIAKFASASA